MSCNQFPGSPVPAGSGTLGTPELVPRFPILRWELGTIRRFLVRGTDGSEWPASRGGRSELARPLGAVQQSTLRPALGGMEDWSDGI